MLRKKTKIQKAVLDWANVNRRQYAWRRQGVSPYEVLIAEILLKRTTATAASRIYHTFLGKYPDVETLSKASRKDIEKILKPIGYYKLRSKQLLEIAYFVKKEFGGKIPSTEQELLRIPYVGPYTAGAILCMCFGKRVAMVDSNIERILRRVFSSTLRGTGCKTFYQIACSLVPEVHFVEFNLGLLDLGALVCRPRKAKCYICPIKTACDYAIEQA